jgi:hypothetical protein
MMLLGVAVPLSLHEIRYLKFLYRSKNGATNRMSRQELIAAREVNSQSPTLNRKRNWIHEAQ